MKITFPDGSSREYEAGTTLAQIAESIGRNLAKASLAAEVNGSLLDMTTPLEQEAQVRFLPFNDE